MSTGGNVPSQGMIVEAATTEKKRGQRGKLGLGTPGSRLKAEWRKAGTNLSLKEYASGTEGGQLWLLGKRNGGTDEQRKERKARLKEHRSTNAQSKISRGSKGKQSKKAPPSADLRKGR